MYIVSVRGGFCVVMEFFSFILKMKMSWGVYCRTMSKEYTPRPSQVDVSDNFALQQNRIEWKIVEQRRCSILMIFATVFWE